MEDSLEISKLSPKRKSVSPSAKDDKQRALLQQTKQKFIVALSKLQSSQTREIGIQEIRLLIDRNREPDCLRMFLAVMKSLKFQGTSSSTKEHEILVFSMLAEIFKQNLVDPIDKPSPSRVKTCFRIIEILHTYFKQTTNTVQQACARVLIDLGKHVLGAESPNPSLDTQTFLNLLFSPLASILKSGVDKASQSTASVCINQQIQYWRARPGIQKYRQMLEAVSPEMLTVALKLNCEYQEIFMALQSIIQMKGLQFFGNKLFQFVSKILGVINKINNNKSPQDANNFNTYMCKVNVCGVLQKIGELLKDKPEIKAKLDQLDVVPCLEKATRNRVIQVQMVAARAIKVWNGEQVSPQAREKRPASTPKIAGKGHIMSLQEARNQKKRQRSGSKEDKLKLQRELNHIQEDLHKLVKGGWGPHNRANNFVKKNTGVGGGYCSKMDESPSPKVNKSHKEHIDQLRKFIKQNSKEHGSKEKFMFYEQKNQKRRPFSKQKAQNLPIQSERKKKKAIEGQDQMEFILDENQGDQMVQLPPQQNYRNPYANSGFSGRFDTQDKEWLNENKDALKRINSQNLSGIIDENQMKQLLRDEKQILDLESRKQINSKLTVQPSKNLKNQTPKEGERYGQMTFNSGLQKKEQKSKFNNFKQEYKEKMRKQDSKQAEKQISTLSNQKKPLDYKQQTKKVQMQKQKPSQNKKIAFEPTKIQTKAQKPTPKNIQEVEISVDQSQKMSASIPIAEIMNQSDFQGLGWNPFKANKPNPQEESPSRQLDFNFSKRKASQKTQNHPLDDYKDSLVLSLSREQRSRSKSPPKSPIAPPKTTMNQSKKSQFSLNPKQNQQNKKFNSFTQGGNNQDQDQILDESKYEQSVPYGQKVPSVPKQKIEDYYKKSVEHGRELDKKAKSALQRQPKQKTSEVYQQMIKNPPKSYLQHRLDKVSQLRSQPSQSQQNSVNENDQQQDQNITDIWQRVLEHIENNQLNDAYSLTFQMDDPIYLLRLMLMTQTPLKKLTPANTVKLWQKFLQIYQHRFIDNIFVQMLTSAHRLGGGKGLSRSLSIQETNQLLVELYQLSGRTKGKLSFGAASLYNQIQQSINGKNNRP